MVEAMVERTPEYFRQFAKQYRYFICQSEPIFDHTVTKNFAYSLHLNDDFCKVPGFHYHVIASNDQFPDSFKSSASKPFIIPCLFTCFKLLIKTNLTNTVFCGEIMKKIDEAVNYNEQHQLNFANSKRKLPNVDCVFTNSVQTQTDFLPNCTIDRFYSIYNDGLYGELSKILDILNSGYGCLHVDNSFILINFNMESKSSN